MGECKPLAGRGLLDDLIKDMDSLSQEQKTVYPVSRGSLNPQGPLDKEHRTRSHKCQSPPVSPATTAGLFTAEGQRPSPLLLPQTWGQTCGGSSLRNVATDF